MIGRFVAALLVAGLVAGCGKNDPLKPGSRVLLVAKNPSQNYVNARSKELVVVDNGTEAIVLREGENGRLECKLLDGEWKDRVGQFQREDIVPTK